MVFNYRTVFLSDTHLGFNGVHAEELSAFLKHVECERLYLVGDIIDLLSMRSRWRWPVMHNQVVRRVLKLAKRGTVVTYVPGNHDDALRQYVGLDLGGVRLAMRAIHRTADGRMLLVTHGDEYDLIVKHSPILSMLGTWAYDHLIVINRWVNASRKLLGLKPWSISRAVKSRVKSACTFISNFEQALMAEAKRRDLAGVICGHIHQPAIRQVDGSDGRFLYANCGDWIEHMSALVEHEDGSLEIIDVGQALVDAGVEVKRLKDEPVPIEHDLAEEHQL